MNIIDFFDRGVAFGPERPCFKYNGETWSYRAVQEFTYKLASALDAEGYSPGVRAAVLSGNHPDSFSATLGILRAGLVWCPLNPRNSIGENAHLMTLVGCEILFFQSSFASEVKELRMKVPSLRYLVCLDGEEGDVKLENWMARVELIEGDQKHEPDAVAMIVGTGGTTGLPKGVTLTNRNVETFVANILSSLKFDQAPIALACAPLTHAAGIFAFPLMALGGCHVIHASVDPRAILSEIESSKINFLFLPPTVIYAILAHPDSKNTDYSSLRYLLYGASPMAEAKLREALEVFGPVMAQMFGQSEAPASITYLSPDDHFDENGRPHPTRLRSCGRPTPFVRVAIMDDNGHILPYGERGEIVVRGDLVMKGYFRNKQATSEAMTRDWLHTGDVGFQDKDGFFYIVDRKKDMIISGGYNIYATEVEQTIMLLAEIQDCAVIGVPDEKWGETVIAFIETRCGKTIDPVAVIAHCKSEIGSVKSPKRVEVVLELPRSAVGKVLKRELRKAFWLEGARNVS